MLYCLLYHCLLHGLPLSYLIRGWLYSYGFAIFTIEIVVALFAYHFGTAKRPLRLKAAVGMVFAAWGIYMLSGYLVTGMKSDADILKPFAIYLLFLIPILILIGTLVHQKKG